MTEYGLQGASDAQDHEYEWGGETVRIELVPPTMAEVEEYQEFGEDAEMEDLRGVVDRHIMKPERPVGEMTLQEVNCYIYGIMDHAESGGSDLVQQAREYAAREGGGEGN